MIHSAKISMNIKCIYYTFLFAVLIQVDSSVSTWTVALATVIRTVDKINLIFIKKYLKFNSQFYYWRYFNKS